MPFTLVQSTHGANTNDAISVSATVASTTAGALLRAFGKHEGAATTMLFSGGGAWEHRTIKHHANGDLHTLDGYVLAGAGGATTITLTFGAIRSFPSIIVQEVSYDDVCEFDQDSQGESDSSATPNSGDITTTGMEAAVFGGYGEHSANTTSSEQIDGAAADDVERCPDSAPADNFTSGWYKRMTSIFTGPASATLGGGAQAWTCHVIAFKETTGTPPEPGPALGTVQTGLRW